MLPGFFTPVGMLASGKRVEFCAAPFSTTDLSTYTFTAVNLSSPAADRFIVVGVLLVGSPGRTASTVTIGGVSATAINTGTASTNVSLRLFGAVVPAGSTGDVVVTASGGCLCCSIGVWALYGLSSTTAIDTTNGTSNPDSDTLTTVAGGFVVAVAVNGGSVETYTWSGLTENFDQTVEASTASCASGASVETGGSSLAYTVTRTGGLQNHLSAASFS
jgi:hypothetical protein